MAKRKTGNRQFRAGKIKLDIYLTSKYIFMKKKLFFVTVFIGACSLVLYISACRKEQIATTDSVVRELSSEVIFDKAGLQQILNADEKVAGLCFLPKAGNLFELIAMPYYWEDDNLKPLKIANDSIPKATGVRVPDNNQEGRFMFELCYIPKNEVERLMSYSGTSSNLPIEGLRLKSIYIQQPEKIFSGALLEYQTLMCMPYRKEVAFGEEIERDREAIGYYITPVCPPRWTPR
jgi:hypothetical protein